jgi:tetratricopeptide (TPR) repeat protein
VEILRKLASARPDAFLPDLATSLNNLGGMLSHLGRREDALSATQEAVEILRKLASARPDAFLPDLATSLGLLGSIESASGQAQRAALTTLEAMQCLLPSLQRWPDASKPLGAALAQQYIEACEQAKLAPDIQVLRPFLLAMGFELPT